MERHTWSKVAEETEKLVAVEIELGVKEKREDGKCQKGGE